MKIRFAYPSNFVKFRTISAQWRSRFNSPIAEPPPSRKPLIIPANRDKKLVCGHFNFRTGRDVVNSVDARLRKMIKSIKSVVTKLLTRIGILSGQVNETPSIKLSVDEWAQLAHPVDGKRRPTTVLFAIARLSAQAEEEQSMIASDFAELASEAASRMLQARLRENKVDEEDNFKLAIALIREGSFQLARHDMANVE